MSLLDFLLIGNFYCSVALFAQFQKFNWKHHIVPSLQLLQWACASISAFRTTTSSLSCPSSSSVSEVISDLCSLSTLTERWFSIRKAEQAYRNVFHSVVVDAKRANTDQSGKMNSSNEFLTLSSFLQFPSTSRASGSKHLNDILWSLLLSSCRHRQHVPDGGRCKENVEGAVG